MELSQDNCYWEWGAQGVLLDAGDVLLFDLGADYTDVFRL